jgi:hypothetical protein
MNVVVSASPHNRHVPKVPSDNRLEGGVNRAKLKFTNINTTTSWVSVRNKTESAREGVKTNRKRIMKCDTGICFTEVRFS